VDEVRTSWRRLGDEGREVSNATGRESCLSENNNDGFFVIMPK